MDYPDAGRHRLHDALDVVYSPGINGRCLCILFPGSSFSLELIVPDTGD